MVKTMWLSFSGGYPPEKVDKVTRQLCIDLMIKGYHTTDKKQQEILVQGLDDIALYHFEMIDLNSDGWV